MATRPQLSDAAIQPAEADPLMDLPVPMDAPVRQDSEQLAALTHPSVLTTRVRE